MIVRLYLLQMPGCGPGWQRIFAALQASHARDWGLARRGGELVVSIMGIGMVAKKA
jgi:hypothetical protein